MLQIFINGPPGAGKTTLCKLLCAELRLEHVATGDLLKDNIAQRTELGRVAKQCIASKQLVPDHVVVDMVAERVLECSLRNQGWVLDGFPRTVEQCAALRRKMIAPSVVLILELPERECTKRITGRRFDATTGAIYHLPNLAPRDASVLARLTKRSDDTTDKLVSRFEAYRSYGEKTNAVFRGAAHYIDTIGKTPDELLEDVLALLHAIRPSGNGSSGNLSTNGGIATTALQSNQSLQQQFSSALRLDSRFAAAPSLSSLPQQQQQQQQQSHQSSSLKKKQQPHLVPQKIDEEDDEDALSSIDMQEYNYDCDGDGHGNGSDVKRVAASSSRAHALPLASTTCEPQSAHGAWNKKTTAESSSSSSRSSSSSSNSNNNSEELSSAATATGASASPSPSPSLTAESTAGSATGSTTDSPTAAPLPTHGVDMAKFKDMLLDGFEVLKHGRRGSPHVRLIYTDLDFKRIFWQKRASGSNKTTKRAKLDQSLVLADVVHVVRGMKTDVLKRTGDVAKYERYLSLVADDRTLDMELPDDATCDFLVRGFDVLLHSGH